MNTAIALENLYNFSVSFPEGVKRNSNSSVKNIDKIIEEEQELESKFFILQKNIGDELFDQLLYEQKRFIVDISGTIDLGKSVDIDTLYNRIEKLDYE